MKSFFVLFIMLFTMCVYASDMLDVLKNCNNGHSETGNYAQPAISETSCVLNATRIAPGFDIHQQSDNPTMFFFDSFVYVKMNNKDIPIRFVVYEDEKEYNAIQAIVQTAYATRRSVSVIFSNPKIENNLYDLETFLKKRKTESKCYSNKDLKGDIAFINCPIQSISLSSN